MNEQIKHNSIATVASKFIIKDGFFDFVVMIPYYKTNSQHDNLTFRVDPDYSLEWNTKLKF